MHLRVVVQDLDFESNRGSSCWPWESGSFLSFSFLNSKLGEQNMEYRAWQVLVCTQ